MGALKESVCMCVCIWGFPGGSEVKASASNAGDQGSIPGLGRYTRMLGRETDIKKVIHTTF